MNKNKFYKMAKLSSLVFVSLLALAVVGLVDDNTVQAQSCGGSIGGVPRFECVTDSANYGCQYCNFATNRSANCGCSGGGNCCAQFDDAECDDNYSRCINSGGSETPFCHLFDACYSSRGSDSCSGSCSVAPTPTPIPTSTPSDPGTCWCGIACGSPSCELRTITECNNLGQSCGCTDNCGGSPTNTPTPTTVPVANGAIMGRVFIDWNANGVADDDYYGYYSGIQRSGYSCGNYYTSDAFSVSWDNGTNSGVRDVNEIPPGIAGCSPPPYYSDFVPEGTGYTISLLGLPAGWSVVSIGNPPECSGPDYSTASITCDITQDVGTHVWFGVVPPVSCTIDYFNSSYSITVDQSRTVYAGASVNYPNSYDVDQIEFTRGSDLIAVCDPVSTPCDPASTSFADTSPGFWGEYQAGITGYNVGSTTLTATATLNDPDSTICSETATVNVNAPDAWWNVYGGDVVSMGDIQSTIPSNCSGDCYIINALTSPDVDEGVAVYGSGALISAGTGDISDSGWNAESTYAGDLSRYTYEFFRDRAPSTPVTISNLSDIETMNGDPDGTGYHWFIWEDNFFSDRDVDIGDRKVILFVEGDGTAAEENVVLSHNIQLDDGEGSLMIVANNNIYIDRAVGVGDSSPHHLEGVFFAEGDFITDGQENDDEQLRIRGMIAGMGYLGGEGVDLNRSLPDNAEPGEEITYAPDLVFNFPKFFSKRSVNWKEVVP